MNGNLHRHIFQPSTCLKQEEIRAYLEGKTVPEIRHRVENHMLDCPLCSDAVEGFELRETDRPLGLEGFETFRKKLPFEPSGKIRQLAPARLLASTAAIAALIIVGMVAYFNLFQTPDANALYSQFYSTYQNDIPLKRAPGGEYLLHPSLEKALSYYAAGEYTESIPHFEEALKAGQNNEAATFFAGMACLETGQTEKAAAFFEKINSSGGNYASKASWYLALSKLKSGKKEEAKVLLDELVKSGGFKEKEAKALLEKL